MLTDRQIRTLLQDPSMVGWFRMALALARDAADAPGCGDVHEQAAEVIAIADALIKEQS